ncbi:MAG: hypothetical protein HHJ14_12630 [Cellulomonas sp.]|nr:hypothetical protein [Cellulomonas sp.]
MNLFGTIDYEAAELSDEHQKLHRKTTVNCTSVEQEADCWRAFVTYLNASIATGPCDATPQIATK